MPYCDYKQIAPNCQFGVHAPHTEEGIADCGEPAIYKVWWDEKGEDCLNVCQEHLDKIIKDEDAAIEEESRQGEV
jgi:hypothetical protein